LPLLPASHEYKNTDTTDIININVTKKINDFNLFFNLKPP